MEALITLIEKFGFPVAVVAALFFALWTWGNKAAGFLAPQFARLVETTVDTSIGVKSVDGKVTDIAGLIREVKKEAEAAKHAAERAADAVVELLALVGEDAK